MQSNKHTVIPIVAILGVTIAAPLALSLGLGPAPLVSGGLAGASLLLVLRERPLGETPDLPWVVWLLVAGLIWHALGRFPIDGLPVGFPSATLDGLMLHAGGVALLCATGLLSPANQTALLVGLVVAGLVAGAWGTSVDAGFGASASLEARQFGSDLSSLGALTALGLAATTGRAVVRCGMLLALAAGLAAAAQHGVWTALIAPATGILAFRVMVWRATVAGLATRRARRVAGCALLLLALAVAALIGAQHALDDRAVDGLVAAPLDWTRLRSVAPVALGGLLCLLWVLGEAACLAPRQAAVAAALLGIGAQALIAAPPSTRLLFPVAAAAGVALARTGPRPARGAVGVFLWAFAAVLTAAGLVARSDQPDPRAPAAASAESAPTVTDGRADRGSAE